MRALVFAVFVVGCGSEVVTTRDAGVEEVGDASSDGWSGDGGWVDPGTDSGVDSGSAHPDAYSPDGGAEDAGTDSGSVTPDAGAEDPPRVDAGIDSGVDAGPTGPGRIVEVSVAYTSACALDSLGVVRCWGGLFGPRPTRIDLPAAVIDLEGPNALTETGEVRSVFAPGTILATSMVELSENNGGCALGRDHVLYCAEATGWVPYAIPGSVVQFSGDARLGCAVTTVGGYCWTESSAPALAGLGTEVATGTDVIVTRISPTTVQISTTSVLTGECTGPFSVSGSHYVLSTTALWSTWGRRMIPYDTTGVEEISTSTTYACIVDRGTARCWGDNTSGQLGDGTTTSRDTPVDVVW